MTEVLLPDLPARLQAEVPTTLEGVDAVHDLLAAFWEQQPDVPDLCRMRVETATVEIVANVVEHAFAADETSGADGERRRLTIAVGRDDTVVTVACRDNGQPAAIDLSDVAMPGDDAESGRGLAMALQVLDDLRYEHDNGRNLWSMTCAL
ncbi:ATP-binding protein [Nocardioides sp. SOB44]|uniref:ATP-binding protein n=1 Tax=Nocardioides cremeus TaxID=3058044 RepID=A0ABT8TME2_9ACTN|nr:ATP-binding protein [Nocardioides cremeus]MDO3395136.1 ATP-binding protein [Nocardioides cremeus]